MLKESGGIAIIDYGMGNLRSVQKAFERLNIPAELVSDPDLLARAEKIVLPGVGHFANGMKRLADQGWIEAMKEEILRKKKPLLGICLGMQLLTKHSEEGDVEGLGFIDAETIRFTGLDGGLKIPHMGWNEICQARSSPLFNGLGEIEMVYFVHSYHVKCHSAGDVLCTTDYGIRFDSAFQHDHIIGFQFHPEKSHKSGLTLLKNFSKL
jgi:glutamine amidotransferase